MPYTTNHSGPFYNAELGGGEGGGAPVIESSGSESTLSPVTETAPQTTENLTATPAIEYDEIKYNGEAVRIPVNERQTYLQKGYNYDKVQSQLEETKKQAAYLERVAKYNGFNDTSQWMQAFEQAEQQKLIEAEADRLGVDEAVIREHLSPLRNQLTQYEQQLKTIQQQEALRQVEAEVASLTAKYPDFEQYRDKVFDMALQRGYKLEDAYVLASHHDKLESIAKQKEQEVLANVTRRDNNQLLPSNDGPANPNISIADASFEDIQKISERVQRGERIIL